MHSITLAFNKDPADITTRDIKRIINDVAEGLREPIRALVELMTPKPKTTALLEKLFGGGR